MKLSGLHFLLTYRCIYECDHCFVFGGPFKSGVMSLDLIGRTLDQAGDMDGLDWIYFEGGEPFLYYAILLAGVRKASDLGFKVGIVTNAYWATEIEDAVQWLKPLAGSVQNLSLSCDDYHGDEGLDSGPRKAAAAAEELGIPVNMMSVAQPEDTSRACEGDSLPSGSSAVRFRGRAAEKLTGRAAKHPWRQFTSCPCEDLVEPGRLHLDYLGNLHICQGIVVGNILEAPLEKICRDYDARTHAIAGPLLRGGPSELIKSHGLDHEYGYADACHLCYCARLNLRAEYPDLLGPDQMYEAAEGQTPA